MNGHSNVYALAWEQVVHSGEGSHSSATPPNTYDRSLTFSDW